MLRSASSSFARPAWDIPRAVDRLGCTLTPDGESVETDQNGRIYRSMEELGIIAGDQLVLMQASAAVARVASAFPVRTS